MAIRNIDYSKCTHCGICARNCPADVFDQIGTFVHIARRWDCITCYGCEHDCPLDCIYVAPERERLVVLPFDPEVVNYFR